MPAVLASKGQKLNQAILRFISAAALFALWGGLVFLGKADASSLVLGIQAALLGLGVFHTAMAVPGQQIPAAPAAPQPQHQPEQTQ